MRLWWRCRGKIQVTCSASPRRDANDLIELQSTGSRKSKRVVLRPPRTTFFPGAFFMRRRSLWRRHRLEHEAVASVADRQQMHRRGTVRLDDLPQPGNELIHRPGLQISGDLPNFAEQFIAADHAALVLDEVSQQ